MSQTARKGWEYEVRQMFTSHVFQRPVFISDIWESDISLTLKWTEVKPRAGGPNRHVRCGVPFQGLIEKELPNHVSGGRDPTETLMKLLCLCVPHARSIFLELRSPIRFLELNVYILDKTLVYIIVALSKWMGHKRYSSGIYGKWPPSPPDDLVPRLTHHQPLDLTLQGSQPSTAASSSSMPPK